MLKLFLCAVIDKNGLKIKLPNNWDGSWTSNNKVFKFKPLYMYSIGEGIIQNISDKDYHNIKSTLRGRVSTKVKDYNIDKLLIDAGGSEYDLIKCLDMDSFIRLKEIGVIYYADFYNAKKREHLEYKEIVQILKNYYKYVQHNNNPYGELYLLIHAFENLLI